MKCPRRSNAQRQQQERRVELASSSWETPRYRECVVSEQRNSPQTDSSAQRPPKAKRQPGPVQLFLNSVRRLDGRIRATGEVAFPGEKEHSAWTAPINWFRTWLKPVGQCALVATAARRRPTMAGATQIDLEAHRLMASKLTEAQRKDLLMIQSGALWTAHGLHKAGFVSDNTCPWCGQSKEDLLHLWWQCPRHQQHCAAVFALLQTAVSSKAGDQCHQWLRC